MHLRRLWCLSALLLLSVGGCLNSETEPVDSRPPLASMPAATRENILGIVDSTGRMLAAGNKSEAAAFMEEQVPTFEEYAQDPQSPYADLYQQMLAEAKAVASGENVKQSLDEIKKLALQLPEENPSQMPVP